MRFLLLLILIYAPHGFAQKTLGRDTFMVNVRPALNAILSDFYQMITLFPDFPKGLIPLIQELEGITSEKEALKERCPRTITVECKDTLNSIRGKLLKIKLQSLSLMKDQEVSKSLHLNALSGWRLISDFDSDLEEVKGYLDNTSFLITAQIPHKRPTYTIIKELDELHTLLSLAVVAYIPYDYRNDFRHFYFNFVHPVQIQISKFKNYEFLNRNVNSLNFAINLLNMNLTKRNKKTPDGMGPYLAVMHNRWNSLLRYYF
jgi:hypothetical protein